MLFSGIVAGYDVETAALGTLLDGRCKKNEATRTNAALTIRTAAIDTQRFTRVLPSNPALALSVSIFVCLLCLNFSGNCGLPKSPA